MTFSGDFETHLTIEPRGHDEAALRAWCEGHGAKFTHIVLERGASPSQPMVTVRGRGTLAEQQVTAAGLIRALAGRGSRVVRVKIETTPWAAGVPQDDGAALGVPGGYFESHLKLSLPAGTDLDGLAALVAPHGAHLSRNARRAVDALGRQERFVTQRCRGVGRPAAGARLAALRAELARGGFEIVEVEEEFVVHDDHPAIDAGWIEGE